VKPVSAAETIQIFWDSPFPATLQGADFRLIDVNPAYLEFTGYSRDQLIGLDPLELQPPEDREASRASRRRLVAGEATSPFIERRLIDAAGRTRWFRASRRALVDDQGKPCYLIVLQDCTEEHVASERAEASLRELDHWFELSPAGMVLYDETGLILRSNPTFEALVGPAPGSLLDAPSALRELLGVGPDGLVLATIGADVQHFTAAVMGPDAVTRRLRASIRTYAGARERRRCMAVIEDRSADDENELARIQIGALMDTAGIGVATFRDSNWLHERAGIGDSAPSTLQKIGRDIVEAASLPAYEQLQTALRAGERAEVRYAIRHPELGARWLLTRAEPATLGSGQRTMSVVTLDITEQERSRARNEQLLAELTTILESTTAGIASLRGSRLVRCNQRFEAMLGLAAGSVVGRPIEELFGGDSRARRVAAETLQALADGAFTGETEFELPGADGPLWYSLSVRRTARDAEGIDAIAVLADITRLKTQQHDLEVLARDRELMFSLSEVGIAYVRHGRIQRANDAMVQLTGWPADRLNRLELGRLCDDPEEYRRQWAEQERVLRERGSWTGEQRLRRFDGSSIWVQVSQRLVQREHPDGGVISAYVDVDARYRAEQALKLQAERTRAILDSVLVGIVIVGRDGIEWMNRSARRMFGGDLVDFVHHGIDAVAADEDDHPFRRNHYLAELAEGQAETFECRVKARDGRTFWIVGNVVATGDGRGGRQLTWALLDIERRRQAEARMSQAQVSLQRVIEAAPLAITLRDAATLRIVQVNEVAASSVENTPAALIGRTPEEIFDPPIAAERRADMEAALRSQEVTVREYRVVDARGQLRVWDARYLPLSPMPGESPDQLLLVATDVTEQHSAQEARFAAAIAQREMLVKEVHHRIKNNLQGVAGLLQQIGERKPEMAGVISEVVGQVQAIAQVYGLQVGTTGALRLKTVVEAITSSLARTFGRDVRFEARGPAQCDWVLPESESIPIALAVNELLTNAIKHGSGAVDCRLDCERDGARLAIANRARLPDGFDLGTFRSGVSGLGLVRSLLPRRSAALTIEQQGEQVVACVTLAPPAIARLEPA
jgi:PAS domain S-box-containing protein